MLCRVKWTEPHRAKIDNMTILTSAPPGAGVLVTFMLEVLKDLVPAENDKILWQRIIETYKFAYAKRAELGDPDFVNIGKLLIFPLTIVLIVRQLEHSLIFRCHHGQLDVTRIHRLREIFNQRRQDLRRSGVLWSEILP